MDPLTHMVTGALVAQTMAPEEHRFAFALVAAGAGMVSDVDFLARKASERLLFFKLHRGLTHSLAAAPLVAACASASGHLLFGTPFWPLFWVGLLASLSHLVLDTVMHSTGLQLLWPAQKKISLPLVVGLNPLTSSARCGERSLGVCLRCTMHSAVLSPLVLIIWAGFAVCLAVPGPLWVTAARATLVLAGLYLLLCVCLRVKARAVLQGHLTALAGDPAQAVAAPGRDRAEGDQIQMPDPVAAGDLAGRQARPDPQPGLPRVRVFPASFNPTLWLGVVAHARSGRERERYRVVRVHALRGRLDPVASYGPSDTSDAVRATIDAPTVQEFLHNAVFPHASVHPAQEATLVVWRDLAFAFSPTVCLFAARLELDGKLRVASEEFRERWDRAPESIPAARTRA